MKCNGLKCRCGETDKWSLEWGYTGVWELDLECECGAVYTLGTTENEHIKVEDLVSQLWKEQQKD